MRFSQVQESMTLGKARFMSKGEVKARSTRVGWNKVGAQQTIHCSHGLVLRQSLSQAKATQEN